MGINYSTDMPLHLSKCDCPCCSIDAQVINAVAICIYIIKLTRSLLVLDIESSDYRGIST
nr:MAG TPA: hypothetical protein [Caudoviricetes sp.]